MQYLLIGNFGVGNLGDEALREYFLERFPVDWKVISACPSTPTELPRLPGGIRSFFSLRWLKTIRAYYTCDAVVFGGGSLFTDSESSFACVLWWIHAIPAILFRKPIHLAFQGIGPFTGKLGAILSYGICRQAASISVRDSLSFMRLESRGLSKKCIQSCDPVFHLFKNKKQDLSSQNILILIPRNNSSDKFRIETQKAIQSTSWDAIRILSMKPNDKSEQEYCQTLIDMSGENAVIEKIHSIDEILQNISDSGLVISERYHGALAALALGKTVHIIPQTRGDKLDSLLADRNQDWDTLLQVGEELLGL